MSGRRGGQNRGNPGNQGQQGRGANTGNQGQQGQSNSPGNQGQRGRGNNSGNQGQRGRGASPGNQGQQGRGSNPWTRGRVTPFDGPASRGSGSAAGSQSRGSGPPSLYPTPGPSVASMGRGQGTASLVPAAWQAAAASPSQGSAPPSLAAQNTTSDMSMGGNYPGAIFPKSNQGPAPSTPQTAQQAATPAVQQQAAPAAQQAATPIARDPAREGPAPRKSDSLKYVDMPASFYNVDGLYKLDTALVKRNGNFNTTGKQFGLPLNTYRVLSMPTQIVHQYDVIIGNGVEKRAVNAKVWRSKQRLAVTGDDLIYDGNKLAWSLADYQEVRKEVDLDEEEGRGPSTDRRNVFRLHIKKTKRLDLSVLTSFLQGKIQHDVSVIEAMNFLDHLLREGPSRNPNLLSLKRSYFLRDKQSGQYASIGDYVEAYRGVYQSIRVAEGGKLTVNLDVANSCFYTPQDLRVTIQRRNGVSDAYRLEGSFTPSAPGNAPNRAKYEIRATTSYIKGLQVKAVYAGNKQPNTIWKVKGVADIGITANTHKLAWRNAQGEDTGEMVSVFVYFKRKYNVTLQYPNLNLIEMFKKIRGQPIYFPMELLVIEKHQPYTAKLDPTQTKDMIRFAVSTPTERMNAINQGKSWLAWQNDQWLQRYGLRMEDQQTVTQARILPAPGIAFGENSKLEQPGTKGRWDLRGKKFYKKNPKQLACWGIGYFLPKPRKPDQANLSKGQLEKFALELAKTYRIHGGDVANGLPHIMQLPSDPTQAAQALYSATGNAFNAYPQLLIFIMQGKESFEYLRIKRYCDCTLGATSQMVQAVQVAKGQAQYYSNVLMKINAKLGGCTSRSMPNSQSGFKGFGGNTMFIGADVSHASPGSAEASMAAMTVSLDAHAGRYGAGCESNGHRVEMITDENIRSILGPLVEYYHALAGPPGRVYYMRDGVSEGQFIQVVQEEIPAIRAILQEKAKFTGKITAIVAAKRHHIRAFPRKGDGDQKGNPLPGTLIERDVTMPMEFDFYLYSHIALQGTSRPVHYTVLIDEANHSASMLQNMIYEHCYQYMRSTTSVSLHPAVYYAHLASKRAGCHADFADELGPQTGPGYKQNQKHSSDFIKASSEKKLRPFGRATGNPYRIEQSMWFI